MKKAGSAAAAKTKTPPAPVAAPEPVSTLVDLEIPKGAEEVDSGDVDVILTLDPGDQITGIYRGYKEVKNSKFGTLDRLHKVEVDGEACGVWGTITLDGALAKIQDGEKVWIGYAGKQVIANGNPMHVWKVARVK